MIAWLWYKITGRCRHKWKTFNKGKHYSNGKVYANFYEQSCDHCGDLREVKL